MPRLCQGIFYAQYPADAVGEDIKNDSDDNNACKYRAGASPAPTFMRLVHLHFAGFLQAHFCGFQM